jgi:hypothetical protein
MSNHFKRILYLDTWDHIEIVDNLNILIEHSIESIKEKYSM